MKQDTKLEMGLKSYDDIFKLNTGKDGKAEMVVVLSIDDIDDFKNHPFKIKNDEKMQEMVESVKQNGILLPVLVRPKGERGYEMISGHRRKFACNLAGKKEIPAIVRELTDDEATILMVDSNMQREEILPSERAFAYKMKLEAMKHQGKDINETCDPMEHKLKSREVLANEVGDSASNVQRYIRLTYLIPELLELVDEKRIAFRPAVELSFLKLEEQEVVLDCIKCLDCTPSLAQAIDMKKRSQENSLTADKIDEIMSIEKANQIPKLKLNEERFEKVIPSKYVTTQQKEDYLYMCAEYVQKRERMKQQQLSR